jgi:hypothetical protein
MMFGVNELEQNCSVLFRSNDERFKIFFASSLNSSTLLELELVTFVFFWRETPVTSAWGARRNLASRDDSLPVAYRY